MVVSDEDFSVGVDADADRVVGDPFAAHLAQELTFVVEHLEVGERRRDD